MAGGNYCVGFVARIVSVWRLLKQKVKAKAQRHPLSCDHVDSADWVGFVSPRTKYAPVPGRHVGLVAD